MIREGLTAIRGSLGIVLAQTLVVLPKIIIALLIWVIGKYLIRLAVNLVEKVDLGIKVLPRVVSLVSRFILILVVLDYLGIGRTVIGALANGLSLAIAVALGIAFGQALVPEAKKAVGQIKKELKK